MTTIVDEKSSAVTDSANNPPYINPNAKYVVSNDTKLTDNEPKHKNHENKPKNTIKQNKNNANLKNSQKPKEIQNNSNRKTREEQRAKASADKKAQEKADDEEIAKFHGKKSITNKNGKATKSNSSYYLYRSTGKEEAERYKPKKVTANNKSINCNSNKSTSAWNNGSTMEEFDYSVWATKRISELLLSTPLSNEYDIHFSEITKITGTATVLFCRGKFRPGYDYLFDIKWCGKINGKEVKGTLHMNEITSEDACEDWEFEVKIKKRTKGNKIGMKIISENRENIINSIKVFVCELKAKKS